MPDEPKYLSALKKYGKEQSVADLFAVERESSYGTSDRSMAILMGASLESTLGDFLKLHLRNGLTARDRERLFGSNGPLGTFSSKIIMAYCFEYIGPDTRHDLELIRNIRNQFAHSRRPLRFAIKEVANVCAHLKYPDFPEVDVLGSYTSSAPDPTEAADLNNPRTRYFTSCQTISHRLLRLTLGPSPFDATVLPDPPLP
jgi:hypothetical protein